MYSQNDEEEVIARHFGSYVGRFLDIGAYTGTNISNTRKLVLDGWTGVMVECSPYVLPTLIENCRGYPVEIVAAPACPTPGLVKVHCVPGEKNWASTCDASRAGGYTMPYSTLEMPAVTPEDLARKGPFNFLSIDIEGMDFAFLWRASMLLHIHDLSLVCVENGEQLDMWTKLMQQYDFNLCHQTTENLLFSR